jgi:hypothetical protein
VSGAERVELACRFLAEARQRSVEQMPPTLLMRECAELRRLLGQVLDVIDQAPALTEMQRIVLGQVLADAIAYREPTGLCRDCEAHPAGLCEDHAEDLDKTDAYLALARHFGIEVER